MHHQTFFEIKRRQRNCKSSIHRAKPPCHSHENRTGFIDLVADSETLQVAKADFSWQDGKWYELLAERNAEEFIIQIKDGPTLYAQHPEFKNDAPSGSNGLGIAGKKRVVL